MGLPASLSARRDFDAVHRNGRRGRSDGLSVVVLDRADDREARLGLAVGKRCGGAVVRNRIRRRLKAAAVGRLPGGCDVVISAAPGTERMPYQELESHLQAALAATRR